MSGLRLDGGGAHGTLNISTIFFTLTAELGIEYEVLDELLQ